MTCTCPSIMYDIIITWSVWASGNFSGSLVVSMSKANTTGSCKRYFDDFFFSIQTKEEKKKNQLCCIYSSIVSLDLC